MAQLKGLKPFVKAMDNLKVTAEDLRNNLDEKRAWIEEKSERWQESEAGKIWSDHLDSIEELLDEVDNLEIPDIE